MAVSYNDTLKTNRMQLVSDLTNTKVAVASSGAGSTGKLVIGTSALSGATGVLATIVLPNPSMTISTPVAGTVQAALLGVPLSVNAAASGTAAKAEIRNNADAVIVAGLTVGVTPGSFDIVLNSVTITAPQTVSVSAGTITHSA